MDTNPLLTYIQAGVRLYTGADVTPKSCLDNLEASAANRKPPAGGQTDRKMLLDQLKHIRSKFESQIVRLFAH